jgi:SAM-dependent methyltransferase
MEKDLKKRLKEFYEFHSQHGADKSTLLGEYGTNGHDVRDSTRFMVMYEGQLKEIVSMIPTGQDILDVGAGDGVLAGLLLKDAKTLTAMDISMKRIKRCAETCGNGHFIVGDAEELPFRKGIFDCIVASEIIEHLIEPERFLISSHHVLKRGGILIISTPSALFYENNLKEILKDQHLHTFSPGRLKRLLKSSGFKPLQTVGLGFKLRLKIPEPLSLLPRLLYAIILRKRPKRGFIAPVSVEWNLVSNRLLNRLYFKNKPVFKKIFRSLNLIGNMLPPLSSQIIIKAEKRS